MVFIYLSMICVPHLYNSLSMYPDARIGTDAEANMQ